MRNLKLIALAALVTTTMAAPAMARDYCDYHRCHRGPVGAAIGTAGAIAGAAIGTAGAIATAPFRDSYAYDRRDYRRQGFVCEPGTWFRGEDGRRHLCQ